MVTLRDRKSKRAKKKNPHQSIVICNICVYPTPHRYGHSEFSNTISNIAILCWNHEGAIMDEYNVNTTCFICTRVHYVNLFCTLDPSKRSWLPLYQWAVWPLYSATNHDIAVENYKQKCLILFFTVVLVVWWFWFKSFTPVTCQWQFIQWRL